MLPIWLTTGRAGLREHAQTAHSLCCTQLLTTMKPWRQILHRQAGALSHREGPSRPCMAVAGSNRELRKGGFFSHELQILCFLGELATESTWLAQQNPAARHSVRAAVGEIVVVCETIVKMWQGVPQRKAWLWKVPVVEKGQAKRKRNCCNGSLETGWLLMRPSLVGGILVLWPWGTVNFRLTLAAATHEWREQGLKGELVASTLDIL